MMHLGKSICCTAASLLCSKLFRSKNFNRGSHRKNALQGQKKTSSNFDDTERDRKAEGTPKEGSLGSACNLLGEGPTVGNVTNVEVLNTL